MKISTRVHQLLTNLAMLILIMIEIHLNTRVEKKMITDSKTSQIFKTMHIKCQQILKVVPKTLHYETKIDGP